MMAKDGNVVVVLFKDGEIMEFSDVTDYGRTEDGDYYVTRFNAYDIYFNSTEVRLIGRKFDVKNEPRRWDT